MSFVHSLQFRLSALVLLFGAMLIGIGVVRQQKLDVDREVERLRGVASSSSAMLAGLSQLALRRDLPSAVELELGYFAARRELSVGVVSDSRNRILHVTDRQWLGMNLEDLPVKQVAVLARQVRETMSSMVDETDSVVLAAAPFLMGHDMRERGVALLAYDKRSILQAAGRRALEEAIRFSAFLLGACLLLWLALNWMVTERIQRVVRQTERAAFDGEDLEPLQGRDEFALMSRAFCNSLRVQRALWESQQPLWRLVERLQDVFWSVSLVGSHDWYVNPAFEKVWGMKIDEVKNNRLEWMRVVSKADRRRLVRAFGELRAGKGVEDIRLKLNLEGAPRRVLCRSFPVVDENGEVLSIAGLVMDVTESHNVNRKLAEVAEQERRRLGWDLHDDVCQRLVGALFKCNSMVAALKKEDSTQVERLTQVAEELTETTQLTRALARGLAPVLQGGGGLDAALEQLGILLRKSFQVRFETATDPRLPPLQPEAATHLYRIAQELAMNAVKHGGANQIEILLWREADHLQVQVRNNGVPYGGPEPKDEKRGMGMHMIRQRLDALGAQLSFHKATESDDWNLAICEVPIEEVEAEDCEEVTLTGRDPV